MQKKWKGSALVPILIVVAVTVGIVVGGLGMYVYMNSKKGGLGSAEDTSMTEQQNESTESPTESDTDMTTETVSETAEETTELLTQPATENLSLSQIIISGNVYIYQNESIELEELEKLFLSYPDTTFRITDRKASLKAYHDLITVLNQYEIYYIEETEKTTQFKEEQEPTD